MKLINTKIKFLVIKNYFKKTLKNKIFHVPVNILCLFALLFGIVSTNNAYARTPVKPRTLLPTTGTTTAKLKPNYQHMGSHNALINAFRNKLPTHFKNRQHLIFDNRNQAVGLQFISTKNSSFNFLITPGAIGLKFMLAR